MIEVVLNTKAESSPCIKEGSFFIIIIIIILFFLLSPCPPCNYQLCFYIQTSPTSYSHIPSLPAAYFHHVVSHFHITSLRSSALLQAVRRPTGVRRPPGPDPGVLQRECGKNPQLLQHSEPLPTVCQRGQTAGTRLPNKHVFAFVFSRCCACLESRLEATWFKMLDFCFHSPKSNKYAHASSWADDM